MRQGHPRRFGATKQISRGGNPRLEGEIAQSGMLGTTQGAQTQTAAATPIRLGREGLARCDGWAWVLGRLEELEEVRGSGEDWWLVVGGWWLVGGGW
jgi:hypothetical protein